VVVTHRVEDQPPPESEFVFVSGIEAAVERARELAGDGPVGIGGGASVAQQALRAGLVDRLSIHVAPVVLGGGRTLFGMLGTRVDLEPERVLPSPFATHLAYRVLR
jgi:dihydrofolate reductase